MDTSTPSGEMIASVLASFAVYERCLIGQRTKDALAVKRGEGVRTGRPRTMSPQTESLIRELRAAGHSYRAIASVLNTRAVPTAQGGREWHAQTVRGVVLRSA